MATLKTRLEKEARRIGRHPFLGTTWPPSTSREVERVMGVDVRQAGDGGH